MTDFIPTEPGPAAPFGLLNELLSLRAELARSLEENKRVRKDYEIVTVDIAAKDARIAALEAAGNRLGDAAVDGVLTSIEAVTELAEAKARITELENKNSYNLQIVREATARVAELEAERDAKHDEMLEALRDQRIRLGALHDETSANLRDMRAAAKAEIERLSAAAARAESAEAELDISRAAHRMVQSALLSQAAETERAEAELKVARAALEPFADIASNYAGNRVISPDTYHVSTTLGDCYRASVAFAPHPAEREG